MKKYILGVFAIALAVGFSAFKTFAPELTVDAASVTTSNVTSAATYSTNVIDCPGATNPCKLDLGQIDESFNVTDEASFLSYLTSQFSTPALRVAEVNRIAIEFKN